MRRQPRRFSGDRTTAGHGKIAGMSEITDAVNKLEMDLLAAADGRGVAHVGPFGPGYTRALGMADDLIARLRRRGVKLTVDYATPGNLSEFRSCTRSAGARAWPGATQVARMPFRRNAAALDSRDDLRPGVDVPQRGLARACKAAGTAQPWPTLHEPRHAPTSALIDQRRDVVERSARLAYGDTSLTPSVYSRET